jgi:hypothetical protein
MTEYDDKLLSGDQMPYEKVLDIFIDEFSRLHPKKDLPEWFFLKTDMTGISSQDSSKEVIAIVAKIKKDLKPDEWYEERHGKDVLASFVPETKEIGYVINHVPKMLTIFSMEIDLRTGKFTILCDLDILSIDEAKLMKLR